MTVATVLLLTASAVQSLQAQGMSAATRERTRLVDQDINGGADDRSLFELIRDDVIIVGEDGLAYLLAPLGWSGCDWAAAGAVAGTTAGLMLFDEEIQKLPRRNQDPGWYDVSQALNWGGHLPSAEIATGLVYLTGLVSGEDDIRVTGRMLAQTLIYSGSVYLVIRIVAGRSRPSSRVGAYEFDFWQPDNNFQSFPSGHTVVAFSFATVLARRIDHWAASAVLYAAAAAVGMARMYQDHHWSSDVFFGAVLGYTAGVFVDAQERRRRGEGRSETAWSIAPTGNGLSLTIRF